MREIKFRAWDKDNERFMERFDFVRYSDGTLGVSDSSPPFNKYGEVELQQYTGLKDKNGKEIYEGDIVARVSDYQSWRQPVLVEWKANRQRNGWSVANGQMLEVIGTIYENPELLK